MLKRRIAVAIAGLFIGGAGLAAVEQDINSASEQAVAAPEPVQAESTQGEGLSFKSVQRYVESLYETISNKVAAMGIVTERGDTFPPSADDMVWRPLPAQAKYLEDRAAGIQVAARGNGDMFPPSADDMIWKPPPAQAKYLEDRAAGIQMAASGKSDVFPPSADDMVWKPLPAQAAYLEQRDRNVSVATSDNRAAGSME